MGVITNARDGKHSKIGKAGSAMKQQETEPFSGRIKIHVLAQCSALLLRKGFFLIHIPMNTQCCSALLETPTLKFRTWMRAVKLACRYELPPISSLFRLKILVYTNYTLFQLHLPFLSLCERPRQDITLSVSAVGSYLHATVNITVRNYNLYQYFRDAKREDSENKLSFITKMKNPFPLMTPAFQTVFLYA